MKIRVFAVFLAAVLLLSGCAAGRAADRVEDSMEKLIDPAGTEAVVKSPRTVETAAAESSAPAAAETGGTMLTREEAEQIALKHAGFTADQVTYLRANYEIDDGVPQYEVEFHEGHWEYDYEIHAETGEILSFEKDE